MREQPLSPLLSVESWIGTKKMRELPLIPPLKIQAFNLSQAFTITTKNLKKDADYGSILSQQRRDLRTYRLRSPHNLSSAAPRAPILFRPRFSKTGPEKSAKLQYRENNAR